LATGKEVLLPDIPSLEREPYPNETHNTIFHLQPPSSAVISIHMEED